MATAIMGEATVMGRVRPDGTLELDGVVPLDPGPVRVIVQRRREVRSDDTRSVLERIRKQRQAAGLRGRTKEEIDCAMDAFRDESESELREIERLHDPTRKFKE